MSIIKKSTNYLALKEDEPPPKKLITEGDMLIKDLVEKQRKTNVTIHDYLQHQKAFEKVSEHISLTSCHSGTTSLDQLKNVIVRIEDIEYLRSAGLENEDIRLLWDYQENDMDMKYKNVERSVLENKIIRIKKLLKVHETQNDEIECVENKRSLSEEISLAAKPNSIATKLLKFAIDSKQKSEVNSLVNPMDNLKYIERTRFSYLDDEKLDAKKVQKRIRNISTRINNIEKYKNDVNETSYKKQGSAHLFVENSKWDMKEAEIIENPKDKSYKMYTCKPKNFYTIKDGVIVKLKDRNIKEKNLEISEHRLSIEEIRKLPRFKNYNPGQPSNVLYLKNLPKNITEDNLKEIFTNFSDVTFRIMNSRMKGQVFATFSDICQSTQALERINGLLISAKPVVIEYGKKETRKI